MQKRNLLIISLLSFLFLIITMRAINDNGNIFLLFFLILIPIPYITLEMGEGGGLSFLSLLLQSVVLFILQDIFLALITLSLAIYTIIVIRLKGKGMIDPMIIFIGSLVFVILFAIFLNMIELPAISRSIELQNALWDETVRVADDSVFENAGVSRDEFRLIIERGFKMFIQFLPSSIISSSFAISAFIFYMSMSILRKTRPNDKLFLGSFKEFALPRGFGGVMGVLAIVFFILYKLEVKNTEFIMYNIVNISYMAFILQGLSTISFLLQLKGFSMVLLFIFLPFITFIVFLVGVMEQAFKLRIRAYFNRKR